MGAGELKRRLAAILSADAVGYSRLMGDDEEATVRTITSYRELITTLVNEHHGRVVDSPGDNLLAEFPSVVNAVNCAVKVQSGLEARNAGLPENRRMAFRIGINLGDVITEGSRLYGDGVNIAARLESLAEPGGICLSQSVYDQIKRKLDLDYQDFGEHRVKNIAEPVKAYCVRTGFEAAASIAPGSSGSRRLRPALMAAVILLAGCAALVWYLQLTPNQPSPNTAGRAGAPSPARASIAVLPFSNLTGDSAQNYLGDGISDQLIAGLSRVPKLMVIARHSSFRYRGTKAPVQQVGRELGVSHLLDGSVQRTGDRIRITANLVDCRDGRQVWTHSYDGQLTNLFELQDRITAKVLVALQIHVTEGQQVAARQRDQRELSKEVLEGLLSAREQFHRLTREGNHMARSTLQKVLGQDPKLATAWALLAHTHVQDYWFGWGSSRRQSLQQARQAAEKALALDDRLDIAHSILGVVHLARREYQAAVDSAAKAVEINPNGADGLAHLGGILNHADQPAKGEVHLRKAMRLNPMPPAWYYHQLGNSLRLQGKCEKAIPEFEQAASLQPGYLAPRLGLTFCYQVTGQKDKAREMVSEVLAIKPRLNLKSLERIMPLKNGEAMRQNLDAWGKAGIPSEPGM